MTSSVFTTILQQGISRGHLPAKTQAARDWYRAAAKDFGGRIRGGDGPTAGRVDYGRIKETTFLQQNVEQQTNVVLPGNMYMYLYDPKYKEELPYYDRFPLVIPFKIDKTHVWGLNLHYLGLKERAILFTAIYDLTNNKKYDQTTKFKLTYEMLNKAAKFKYFKPCVKCYLKSHLRSKPLLIQPEQWDICLFLPLERFHKATRTQVFADSRKKF